MNFNRHLDLEGKHAFLSASNYHWINYDIPKLEETYRKHAARIRGTELHELACRCIQLGVKLPRSQKTLNLYVNDAIGYRMTPEQVLYFSPNCFGTADTISFRNNILRIHDLKSGESRTSMHQLEIYAAIFCLEYNVDPESIERIELRIYQSDEVVVHIPSGKDIRSLMNKIIDFDKRIEYLKQEG